MLYYPYEIEDPFVWVIRITSIYYSIVIRKSLYVGDRTISSTSLRSDSRPLPSLLGKRDAVHKPTQQNPNKHTLISLPLFFLYDILPPPLAI